MAVSGASAVPRDADPQYGLIFGVMLSVQSYDVQHTKAEEMMTLERKIGKLAEVRFVLPLDMQQLADFMGEIRNLVTHASEPLVFCCDWRHVESFDDTFADTIVWIMRRDNPLIAANGVLVTSPTLFARTEQILKDAKNPRRRAFRDSSSLKEFLDPLLTAAERARRDEFLETTERANLPRV